MILINFQVGDSLVMFIEGSADQVPNRSETLHFGQYFNRDKGSYRVLSVEREYFERQTTATVYLERI